MIEFETNQPESIDVASLAARSEYVFTWAMPESSPFRSRLEQSYRVASETGRGRLYRRYH